MHFFAKELDEKIDITYTEYGAGPGSLAQTLESQPVEHFGHFYQL